MYTPQKVQMAQRMLLLNSQMIMNFLLVPENLLWLNQNKMTVQMRGMKRRPRSQIFIEVKKIFVYFG